MWYREYGGVAPLIQVNGRALRGIASGRSLHCIALEVTENAVERAEPLAAIGLLSKSLGVQEVTQLSMRADDAKGHMA